MNGSPPVKPTASEPDFTGWRLRLYLWLYTAAIWLAMVWVHILAQFHRKTRAFVDGRKGLLDRLRQALRTRGDPVVWIHCASVGEFEQGRPVIEALKAQQHCRVLLTFFSPSGYEACAGYAEADFIFYSPWDLPDDTTAFVRIAQPQLALFVKYEFWPNTLNALRAADVPVALISALFLPNQLFFKPYGAPYRSMLYQYSRLFVQDAASERLLRSVGVGRVVQAGDTRIDRVCSIAQQRRAIPVVEAFADGKEVFVVGSCWPEDAALLRHFIQSRAESVRFVVAPHEVDEASLARIERALGVSCVRYSQAPALHRQVMIVDTLGVLASLYRYGKFAYVGGGLGKGLHSILEAAVYGKPVFFGGKNYKKFREATDLIARGGAFVVSSDEELRQIYDRLSAAPEAYEAASRAAIDYVEENRFATQKIVDYCVEAIG